MARQLVANSYRDEDLIRMVAAYHNCKETDFGYELELHVAAMRRALETVSAGPNGEAQRFEEIGRLAHDYIRNRKAIERNEVEDGGMDEYRALLAMDNTLWAKLVDLVINAQPSATLQAGSGVSKPLEPR